MYAEIFLRILDRWSTDTVARWLDFGAELEKWPWRVPMLLFLI